MEDRDAIMDCQELNKVMVDLLDAMTVDVQLLTSLLSEDALTRHLKDKITVVPTERDRVDKLMDHIMRDLEHRIHPLLRALVRTRQHKAVELLTKPKSSRSRSIGEEDTKEKKEQLQKENDALVERDKLNADEIERLRQEKARLQKKYDAKVEQEKLQREKIKQLSQDRTGKDQTLDNLVKEKSSLKEQLGKRTAEKHHGEATTAKELLEQFPAFTIDMCEDMLVYEATDRQLKNSHEKKVKKAVERVQAFIPTKDTSDSPYKVLNIVLIGKTGAGKSSTGNTILGNGYFIASSSTESVTKTIKVGGCVINGVTVRVADTPGYIDTTRDDNTIATELLKIGASFEEGIHAFMFVRSLGNIRYTPEERRAFQLFRENFTDRVLEHCVLLYTKASEVFQIFDLEEKTIEGYMKKQTGIEDTDLKSVGYRVVGVENVHTTPYERQMQRERLISYIQSMVEQNRGKTYKLAATKKGPLRWFRN